MWDIVGHNLSRVRGNRCDMGIQAMLTSGPTSFRDPTRNTSNAAEVGLTFRLSLSNSSLSERSFI